MHEQEGMIQLSGKVR